MAEICGNRDDMQKLIPVEISYAIEKRCPGNRLRLGTHTFASALYQIEKGSDHEFKIKETISEGKLQYYYTDNGRNNDIKLFNTTIDCAEYILNAYFNYGTIK